MKKRIAVTSLIVLLIAGNVFLAIAYLSLRNRYAVAEQAIAVRTYNAKVVYFATLFVEKVLKAEGEIGFEDRLTLETAVRDIKDKAVLDGWIAFTKSQTEEEAQNAVKILLGLLMERVRV